MQTFYRGVVKHRKWILAVFGALFVLCFFCRQLVAVDYDMNDYLPEDSPSTVALEVMEQEFEGGIPNARVMIHDVSLGQALEYKAALEQVDGVTGVNWLDDLIDVNEPLETASSKTVESWYKDSTALYSVTIEDAKREEAVAEIRALIGDENAMTGSAVSTAIATQTTVTEVGKIAAFAVAFVLFVLILTTTSWMEPVVVLAGLGVAIILNAGSNLIFGQISFVTNAAGNILQMAVSLDYSVFLLHRFTECRKSSLNVEDAMVEALCKSTTSILSSGLTTVIGFLALCLMRFGIGPDLGLALAKGVAISLITVFIFSPALILTVYKWLDKLEHRPFLPNIQKFGGFVQKAMLPMVAVFVVVMVPAYLASVSNSYYYGASHIFGSETQLGADTAAIEKEFGKSDTYVLLVPQGEPATEKQLSDALHEIPQVTGIISYVDKAGAEIPTAYVDSATLSKLISADYSRMVLSVDADYEGTDTEALIETVRATAQQYYPDVYYMAGEGVSTYDLMDTVTADMTKVNLVAIGAVLFVLVATMRTLVAPLLLVLSIETAIWLNLAIPYFAGQSVFYIAYLIISSIQLGATVDYAILFTDRYKELRETMPKKQAVRETVAACTVSILTSASVLTVVGFLLGVISTHGLLSQLGFFLGKGTLCSLVIVLFVLPGLLYLFDGFVVPRQKKESAKASPAPHRKLKTNQAKTETN